MWSFRSSASNLVAPSGGSNGVRILLGALLVKLWLMMYWAWAELALGHELCSWLPRTRGKTLYLTLDKWVIPFGQFLCKKFMMAAEPSLQTLCGGVIIRFPRAKITARLGITPREFGSIFNLLLHTLNRHKASNFPRSSGSSLILLWDKSSFSSFTRCVNDFGSSFSLLWQMTRVRRWKRRPKLSGNERMRLWLRLIWLRWGRRRGSSTGISVMALKERSIRS